MQLIKCLCEVVSALWFVTFEGMKSVKFSFADTCHFGFCCLLVGS